jgi:four helix bundle protein
MNIVEGFGRRGTIDKLRFYNIAEASMNEAHYQLRLSHDLGYADTTNLRDEATQISRMLVAYASKVRTSSAL